MKHFSITKNNFFNTAHYGLIPEKVENMIIFKTFYLIQIIITLYTADLNIIGDKI